MTIENAFDLPPLCVSFSGGRSSAVMTKICIDEWKGKRQIFVLFANTGLEHPATLEFVDACDRHWGLGVIWLEAVPSEREGVAFGHKIVSYETASRNGEPFRAFVARYGIPNHTSPKCTDVLKLAPMMSYRKQYGITEAETAIGIRADEIDRMNPDYKKKRIIYPLIDRGITKSAVNAATSKLPWDLKLPGDHYGNCATCWKKSDRKLYTIALEAPEFFDPFRQMEEDYGTFKAEGYKASAPDGRRYFFRGHRSSDQIIAEAQAKKIRLYKDVIQGEIWDDALDLGLGCSDSCEVF